MRTLLANRLLWRGAGCWPGDRRQAILAGSGFSLLLLAPWLAGVCGCTMFEIGAFTLVLAAALLGGNSVYGAITGEREKKTLDCLRLTQVTPLQVVVGKVAPELLAQGRLVAAAAPALFVLALLGGVGLKAFLLTLVVAALAGAFASVSGIFVSSLATTTSQAVVGGWALKGLWLLGTPILDLVARAVLVQRDPVPLFTAANPLAAVALATVPEAAQGGLSWVVPLYVVILLVANLGMLWVASRRVAQDPTGGLGIEDGRVHAAYRAAWAPRWLQELVPGLSRNASFLREVAFQSRTGGGSWPGYLVYLVLFLAPFLYSRAWAVKGADDAQAWEPVRVEVSTQAPVDLPPTSCPSTYAARAYGSVPGESTTLVFSGHRPDSCFRLVLLQDFGVPMPPGSVQVAIVADEPSVTCGGREVQVRPLDQVDNETLAPFGMAPRPELRRGDAPLGPEARAGAMSRALQVGLTGTLILFLLYLSLRCTGFLAGALTGEKDRRSWQDLALTGIPASQVLSGKLLGALFFPLLQMTVVFPVLSLFVVTGSLTLTELLGLYFYSMALALTAGLLGLWSSAHSPSTHRSQGRAVALALGAFVLGPLAVDSLGPILVAVAGLGTMLALERRSSTWVGWLAMTLGLVIAPQALSPVTAVVGFMPSLTTGMAGFLGPSQAAPLTGGLGLVHFLGAMLFLAGAALALSRGTLEQVVDGDEGSALRAEPR